MIFNWMLIFAFLSLICLFVYFALIILYLYNWNKIKILPINQDLDNTAHPFFISVVIAARNEANQIQSCLDSLQNQTLPRQYWECIIVNDHSSDKTEDILKMSSFKIFNAPKDSQGKKMAIDFAINQSVGEIIVTTDADCTHDKNWLFNIHQYFLQHQKIVALALPVKMNPQKNNFFQNFQALDFSGLQLITGASFGIQSGQMCNGANFAYRKSAFREVKGFEDIKKYASGDDVQLLNKFIARFGNKTVSFFKHESVITSTTSCSTITEFWSQRLRWGTKNKDSNDLFQKISLAIVYISSVVICFSLFLDWRLFLGLLAIKSIADFLLLNTSSKFFNQSNLMKSFFTSQLLHIIYIVIIGTISIFGKSYTWKNRNLNSLL